MIELGKNQKLKILNFNRSGALLYDGKDKTKTVLLPKEEVPKKKNKGDEVSVFIYEDKGRYVATTKRPYLEVGELGLLRVVNKIKIGAFMDMGLDKDVLLPFAEMIGTVGEHKSYLVKLYVDKTNRLAVTMKIRDSLSTDSPYKENDWVIGTIYSIHDDYGIFVAIDEKYDSLIPKEEAKGIYEIGEVVQGRVSQVYDDGKLVISLKDRAYLNIDEDSEMILDLLEDNEGELKIGDKSTPEEIKKMTGLSKSAFKRAIGKLYKEREIKIYPKKIEMN